MRLITNTRRNVTEASDDIPFPSIDAKTPLRLLAQCPQAAETPLLTSDDLAKRTGTRAVHVKDERARMGLGSFKALGAAYVIAHDAVAISAERPETALVGQTYVTASAGNHGLSVAAGARAFGAKAVIYLAETVPEAFAERLRAKGAEVFREGAIYEGSMAAAEQAASDNGWTLLSDSSWPGYTEIPHRLMEGYLAMIAEVATSLGDAPSHILLQAGVGGMAASVAAYARALWGATPTIIVVEPEWAPALQASIEAGHAVVTEGPASSMGRLDCKIPSLIALKGLMRDADFFATISENEAADAMPILTAAGLETTPSGGAGFAAVIAATSEQRQMLGLDETSTILAFLSEGPES